MNQPVVGTFGSPLLAHPLCGTPGKELHIKTKVYHWWTQNVMRAFTTLVRKPTSIDLLLMKCAWGCLEKVLFFSKTAHLTPIWGHKIKAKLRHLMRFSETRGPLNHYLSKNTKIQLRLRQEFREKKKKKTKRHAQFLPWPVRKDCSNIICPRRLSWDKNAEQ